jgi:hypothetical protein
MSDSLKPSEDCPKEGLTGGPEHIVIWPPPGTNAVAFQMAALAGSVMAILFLLTGHSEAALGTLGVSVILQVVAIFRPGSALSVYRR